MSFIEFKNTTKNFGDTIALNSINLSIEKNKIYGLLGRNGAGKTTMLNLLTNKLFATSGEILVDGQTVVENDEVQGRIYCMMEQRLYPESMKVKDILTWTKSFYPNFDKDYAYKLADKFSLNVNKKVKELSTGYSSIYKIIVALACNAEILIFDEPVLGLDANHRDLFYKELIIKYSQDAQTIILSTHLVQEIADLIEEVIIIDKGKILLTDQVEKLLSKGYTVSGTIAAVDDYTRGMNVLGEDVLGGLKSTYILDTIDKNKVPAELEISKINLQKLFVYLTNEREVQ